MPTGNSPVDRALMAAALLLAAGCGGGSEPAQTPSPAPVVGPSESGASDEALPEARVIDLGRRYAAWLYDGRADSLWAASDDRLRELMGGPTRLAGMLGQMRARFGSEQAVVNESVGVGVSQLTGTNVQVYRRDAHFSDAPQVMTLKISIEPDERIAGFFFTPAQ